MTHLQSFLLILVTPNNLSARLLGSLLGIGIATLFLLLTTSYGAVFPVGVWTAPLVAAAIVSQYWLQHFSIQYLYGGPYDWKDFFSDVADEMVPGFILTLILTVCALLITSVGAAFGFWTI